MAGAENIKTRPARGPPTPKGPIYDLFAPDAPLITSKQQLKQKITTIDLHDVVLALHLNTQSNFGLVTQLQSKVSELEQQVVDLKKDVVVLQEKLAAPPPPPQQDPQLEDRVLRQEAYSGRNTIILAELPEEESETPGSLQDTVVQLFQKEDPSFCPQDIGIVHRNGVKKSKTRSVTVVVTRASKKDNLMKKESRGRFNDRDNLRLFHRMSDGLRARKKVLEELPNVNWVAFSGHRLFTLCMKTESGGVVYRKNILSPNDIQQSKTETNLKSSKSRGTCVGMLLCVGTMCAVFIPYLTYPNIVLTPAIPLPALQYVMNLVRVVSGDDEEGRRRRMVCCYRCCWVYWVQVCCTTSTPFSLSNINLYLLVICNCSIRNPGPRGLKVLYNNVQGLISPGHLNSASPPLDMTKIYEIQDYVYDESIDIVILNESWLKSKISSSSIFPTNYKVFRLDRSAVKLCLSTFYRVGTLGDVNFAEFKQHFDCLFSSRNITKHILIGDFNFPLVNWPTSYPRNRVEELFLSYLLSDLGHTQLISSPTHCKGRTLDLMFTNDPSCVTDINVLDQHSFCFSDHFPVSFTINIDVGDTRQARRKIRLYDKGDYENMSADLSFIDWAAEFSGDINYNVNRFNTILYSLLDNVHGRFRHKPILLPIWYDYECESARVRKENLRNRWKESSSQTDYDNYKAARIHFKNVCNSSSRLYCDIDDRDVVSRKFWRQVKVTSKSTRIPPIVNNPLHKSRLNLLVRLEKFQHFASNFSEPSSYDINVNSNNHTVVCDFSASSVYNVLSKLNARKGPGPDDLHSIIFKRCAGSLAHPLSLLFEQAYSGGGLPAIWKSANVVPVHKSGDKRDVRNYRPISLTCIASKVYERIVTQRILDHCYDKIDSRQHGFLPGRSCLTQLVSVFDDLVLTDNDKRTSDLIYFDFSKALSVNHDLILYKLKHTFNIDGNMLAFIQNYLCDRTQRVVVGGKFSSSLQVLSGVPQGSILGPLLFVLFINDITECVEGECKMALIRLLDFETRLIASMQDHIDMQLSVNNLHQWSIMNKMNFHPNKCKVVSTRSARCEATWGQLPCFLHTYVLGDVVLDNVTVQRDLGVLVNNKLSWTDHTEHILQQFTDRFNLVRRTTHFTNNINQRRILFLTLVRSLLEHCSPVWAPQSVGLLDLLEAAQKRSIKWVLACPLPFPAALHGGGGPSASYLPFPLLAGDPSSTCLVTSPQTRSTKTNTLEFKIFIMKLLLGATCHCGEHATLVEPVDGDI
eukprot:sb/3461165/